MAILEVGVVFHNQHDVREIAAVEYITDGPYNEWEAPVDFDEFVEINEFDENEAEEIRAILISEGRAWIGGGAAALVQIIAI